MTIYDTNSSLRALCLPCVHLGTLRSYGRSLGAQSCLRVDLSFHLIEGHADVSPGSRVLGCHRTWSSHVLLNRENSYDFQLARGRGGGGGQEGVVLSCRVSLVVTPTTATVVDPWGSM